MIRNTKSVPRGVLSVPERFAFASLVVAAGVVLFLWYIGVLGGNVHVVQPGRFYRSAQLTGSNLDTVLATDHIKEVINLRGGDMANAFYRSELASCRRYGARHVDITLSARKLPNPAKLRRLLQALDQGPYPVLMHCQAGADRTGLASTLYLNIYRGVPLDQAESRELTWRYGHFSFGDAHAMDDFFRLYRRTSGGLDLRDWIRQRYPTAYANAVG